MAKDIVTFRVNTEIRAKEVRLVGDNVSPGVYSIERALGMADAMKLDLIEISNNGMPVCKLMEYGKFLYENKKKQKELNAQQRENKMKEIQLRPNIDDHDLEIKNNQARGFLEAGNTVRVVLSMKGREMQHLDAGKQVVSSFISSLSDVSTCDDRLSPEGKKITVTLRPKKKK